MTINNYKQATLQQFGFFNKGLHERVSAAPEVPDVEIGIAHRQCGNGKGAQFDHHTLQLATQLATQVLRDPAMPLSPLKHRLKQSTVQLPFGIEEEKDYGLLFLPGVARTIYESADYEPRKAYQSQLIRKARLEGRPMLAVCGGCWQLFEEFGGKTVEVKDHNYRGGMPRIKDTTGKVGHNKQMHRLALEGLLLGGAMKLTKTEEPTVNSVHWLAPSEENIPPELEVAARSLADPELAPAHLEPEPCIEAFESKSGAPIIGVQWHPEAYTANTPDKHFRENHRALLQYMAEAGKVFQLKKKVLAELKTELPALKRTLYRGKPLLVRNKNSCYHILERKSWREIDAAVNRRNKTRSLKRKR